MTHRKLTENEIKLAQTIFGDSIDYDAVTISSKKTFLFQPENYAMTVSNTVYMDNRYSEDYTLETNPHLHALLIHELTHVWQYQNKIYNPLVEAAGLALRHKFNYRQAYEFDLVKGKDLMEYGLEQQAEIIEEYFLTKHKGMSAHLDRCINKCSDAERLELYESVLDNFLKNPAYAKRKHFPLMFKGKPPKQP